MFMNELLEFWVTIAPLILAHVESLGALQATSTVFHIYIHLGSCEYLGAEEAGGGHTVQL